MFAGSSLKVFPLSIISDSWFPPLLLNFPSMGFPPLTKEKKMSDMNASVGAPWWHYAGAILIGWAMAALMYT